MRASNRINVCVLLALCSAIADADDTKQIDELVRQQVCGTSDCTGMMHSEKTYKNYALRSYKVADTGDGAATALVMTHDKGMSLLKVFDGFGAGGKVVRADILTLKDIEYLEIYEMTSKGNGEVELYQLDGAKLSLLFSARGVDWHDDGSYYENGILKATYPDINGDGHFDIVLDGTVLFTDEKSDAITSKKECKRIFIWDSSSSRFIETTNGEINKNLCADKQ
jgi:hypothetical protein